MPPKPGPEQLLVNGENRVIAWAESAAAEKKQDVWDQWDG